MFGVWCKQFTGYGCDCQGSLTQPRQGVKVRGYAVNWHGVVCGVTEHTPIPLPPSGSAAGAKESSWLPRIPAAPPKTSLRVRACSATDGCAVGIGSTEPYRLIPTLGWVLCRRARVASAGHDLSHRLPPGSYGLPVPSASRRVHVSGRSGAGFTHRTGASPIPLTAHVSAMALSINDKTLDIKHLNIEPTCMQGQVGHFVLTDFPPQGAADELSHLEGRCSRFRISLAHGRQDVNLNRG